MKNLKIHIARFILEATTPIFVGSGKSSLLKDALVQRDANGFPMIPGTSLAGVLRHAIQLSEDGEKLAAALFGSAKDKEGQGAGSPVKVSSAVLLLKENFVSEGLLPLEEFKDNKAKFDQLPVRQHVKITDKGTARDKGLFDNEVVYKGVRFVFEIEASVDLVGEDSWNSLLDKVKSSTLRVGAGTRNGYGLLKPIKSFEKTLTLDEYLNLSPSLNEDSWWNHLEQIQSLNSQENLVHYRLELQPDPFFIFGGGHGDTDVDNVPLVEMVANYNKGSLDFQEENTVIPGSSVKGAIAHRVAFYYNLKEEKFADTGEGFTVETNPAVQGLFGKAGEDTSDPRAGKVFFKDVFFSKEEVTNEKILNHVVIDRFTGGAMEGLLFSEKVSHFKQPEKKLIINIELQLTEETLKYQNHLEDALTDVCRGRLPLGGLTTKGHGIFTGQLFRSEFSKKDKTIFNYQ